MLWGPVVYGGYSGLALRTHAVRGFEARLCVVSEIYIGIIIKHFIPLNLYRPTRKQGIHVPGKTVIEI